MWFRDKIAAYEHQKLPPQVCLNHALGMRLFSFNSILFFFFSFGALYFGLDLLNGIGIESQMPHCTNSTATITPRLSQANKKLAHTMAKIRVSIPSGQYILTRIDLIIEIPHSNIILSSLSPFLFFSPPQATTGKSFATPSIPPGCVRSQSSCSTWPRVPGSVSRPSTSTANRFQASLRLAGPRARTQIAYGSRR